MQALAGDGPYPKKKDLHAAERDSEKALAQRDAFLKTVASLDLKKLVFLDETGVNQGMTRRFARSLHDTRAHASAPINIGLNVSVLAAIRLEEGVVAAMSTEGAFDGDLFLAFTTQILAPALYPGDYVLLDNLGAHRTNGIVDAIEAVGAHVLFLPPYAPDLNPIEHCWSFFKEWLRGQAARTKDALDTAISSGLDLVNSNQVAGWFKGCGYV